MVRELSRRQVDEAERVLEMLEAKAKEMMDLAQQGRLLVREDDDASDT